MTDRLPPLTALRAFDAAARNMSFAKAAEELSVTPAALSFQIKSLEDHLGAAVFRRLNRSVELTEAGHALAGGVEDGFQTLATAWRAAKRASEGNTLTVTAGPAFTAKWLAPRLYDFARANPKIELRVAATLKRLDIVRDGVDVALRFAEAENSKSLFAEPLSGEWSTPVMTPDMAKRFPTPESLVDAPLIHDDSIAFLKPAIDWRAWTRVMGLDFDTSHGLRFSNSDHAVDTALSGAGITLGRRAIVVKDLEEGRLVAPYPVALKTKAQFWFVCQNGAESRDHIAAFRNWIVEEFEKTAHVTRAMTLVDPGANPEDVSRRLEARASNLTG